MAEETATQRVAAGLAKIGLVLKQHGWQRAAPLGLTPTQAQVLALLATRAPGGLSVSDVAAQLAVTTPTVSDAIAALVRKRLVVKQRRITDERVVAVRLTRAGRRLVERVRQWPDFLLAAVDELAPDEQRVFLRGLVKMIRALQEQGRIPVARMCVTCRYFRPHVYPDAERPHHCDYVDAPFGDRDLRLDCADHEVAEPTAQVRLWQLFVAGRPAEAAGDAAAVPMGT